MVLTDRRRREKMAFKMLSFSLIICLSQPFPLLHQEYNLQSNENIYHRNNIHHPLIFPYHTKHKHTSDTQTPLFRMEVRGKYKVSLIILFKQLFLSHTIPLSIPSCSRLISVFLAIPMVSKNSFWAVAI